MPIDYHARKSLERIVSGNEKSQESWRALFSYLNIVRNVSQLSASRDTQTVQQLDNCGRRLVLFGSLCVISFSFLAGRYEANFSLSVHLPFRLVFVWLNFEQTSFTFASTLQRHILVIRIVSKTRMPSSVVGNFIWHWREFRFFLSLFFSLSTCFTSHRWPINERNGNELAK